MHATTSTGTGSAAVQGDLWSERADDWATAHEHTQKALHTAGLDQLAIGPGISMLDVGCGSGTVLRAAADRGAEVTGIDAAPGMVEHARRRVPGALIELGDLQFLPFEGESFDVVTGYNSFQYAADPSAALREAHRVLRDGGRLLIAVWGRAEQCEAATVLAAVGKLLPPAPPGAPGPFALAEAGALASLIEDAGFETLVVADVSTPLEYPDQAGWVRGFGSAGPCALAARLVGADVLSKTLVDAAAPFRRADGSYRLDNIFRFAIGRKS